MLLNRPRTLNALSLSLVEAFDAELAAWAGDPAVETVVVHYCSLGQITDALFEAAGRYRRNM